MSGDFLSGDYLNIVAQMWIAFGRGAGSKNVSAGAVGVLERYYRPLSRQIIGQWDSNCSDVLARAHEIGSRSALAADDLGISTITAENVEQAITGIGVCFHYDPEDGFS